MADFDWGNLIYLAVLILFAVFGGKRKRKRAPASIPDSTYSTGGNETGLFERIFGEGLSPKTETNSFSSPYEDPEEEESVEPEPKVEPAYKFKDYNAVLSTANDESIIYSQTADNKEENLTTSFPSVQEILNEPFDLRRAVIYSEILKRKSF